jgi:hypothetical protein
MHRALCLLLAAAAASLQAAEEVRVSEDGRTMKRVDYRPLSQLQKETRPKTETRI